MKTLSATCVAIAMAIQNKTLRVIETPSPRFEGETYFSIEDDLGLIEVALTKEEADLRIQEIKQRAKL